MLRFVGNSNILENNIVQTIASAAGTLAAIIFVLPGLIMVGWWQGFPYWITVAVCAIGGRWRDVLRAVAPGAGDGFRPALPEVSPPPRVLKVGFGSAEGKVENDKGLRMIIVGSLISAALRLLAAMRFAASEVAKNFPGGRRGHGSLDQPFDGALGVGHLVGLSVGVAMTVGMLIAWAGLVR